MFPKQETELWVRNQKRRSSVQEKVKPKKKKKKEKLKDIQGELKRRK